MTTGIYRRKVNRRPTLGIVTRTHFRDFAGAHEVINEGWCYVWAWLARLHRPEVVLWSAEFGTTLPGLNPAHAFVQIGDRFYDAERPRGVRHWIDLPANTGTGDGIPRYLTTYEPRTFRAYWGAGRHFRSQGLQPWPETLEEALRPSRALRAAWLDPGH